MIRKKVMSCVNERERKQNKYDHNCRHSNSSGRLLGMFSPIIRMGFPRIERGKPCWRRWSE